MSAVDHAHAVVEAPPRRRPPRRLLLALAGAALAVALVVALVTALGGSHSASAARTAAATASSPRAASRQLTPEQRAALADHRPDARLAPHPTLVEAGLPTAEDQVASSSTGANAPHAPSDAEIRAQLDAFKRHLATNSGLKVGPVANVLASGEAVAPIDAPRVVAKVIQAGNAIAMTPYKWGGGHGAWADTGYDCSGSVSFALAGAGLLSSPLDSTGFEHWGAPGPGRWVTVYANAGHAFMVVAGLRFDTSGRSGPLGTRWQPAMRSTAGFVARHPPGL